MRKRYVLVAMITWALLGFIRVEPARAENRIVSMAPSITETLFALGLGNQVVGVTSFCKYPPEAKKKTKIGGYFNPNYEAIVVLEPDMVVTLAEQKNARELLAKLNVGTLAVDHRSVEGILDSITTIGKAFGKKTAARRMVSDIRGRLKRVREKTAGLPRRRVLFCVGRTVGTGKLEDVFVAGKDPFFDKILPLAGGQNAYHDATAAFPKISAEGILVINPEVIIDMVSEQAGAGHESPAILNDWRQVAGVEAVKHGRVHVFQDDFAFVPGPRFILLVEKLARLLHPEAFRQ